MKTTLALAFTLAASAAFSQDVYTVDRVHSEVSFRVRHFVAKTPGRFDDFSGTITVVPGKPAESSVEFMIKQLLYVLLKVHNRQALLISILI